MRQIYDVIEQCKDDKKQERNYDAVQGFMVHRVGVDLQTKVVLGYEAVSVCAAFTGKDPQWEAVAKVTGYQNAYTFMIGGQHGHEEHNGRIWQCMHLDEIGHHARRYSGRYMGIGIIGDPREEPMSPEQHGSLVDLLVELCIGWAKNPYQAIVGHGEVPEAHGGEKAPNEPAWCPGFDMTPIRLEVAAIIQERGRQRLHELGLKF